MKSKHGKAHLLMLVLVITALVLGCSGEEPLEEFVAQAIIDDHIRQLARVTGSMLWVEMGFPLGGSPAVLVKP